MSGSDSDRNEGLYPPQELQEPQALSAMSAPEDSIDSQELEGPGSRPSGLSLSLKLRMFLEHNSVELELRRMEIERRNIREKVRSEERKRRELSLRTRFQPFRRAFTQANSKSDRFARDLCRDVWPFMLHKGWPRPVLRGVAQCLFWTP